METKHQARVNYHYGCHYDHDDRLRTVHTGLGQQTGGVAALLWELAAVGVLRPLQSHNAQHRLALGFGITTQQPATTRQKTQFSNE